MKAFLKISVLTALMALTSCAHHSSSCCCKKSGCDMKNPQCDMHKNMGDKATEEKPAEAKK